MLHAMKNKYCTEFCLSGKKLITLLKSDNNDNGRLECTEQKKENP
jgi:hypothetical protein